jgi:hypothetical protein
MKYTEKQEEEFESLFKIQEERIRKGKDFIMKIKSTTFIITPSNLRDIMSAYGEWGIPDKMGIYWLFSEDKLVYIGMSKNIRRRLKQHLKEGVKVFDCVCWFKASDTWDNPTVNKVLNLEDRMIKKYRPSLNILGL